MDGQWVIGAVNRDSGQCFLIPVHRRSAGNLLPIIQTWIKPGILVISDGWKAYHDTS